LPAARYEHAQFVFGGFFVLALFTALIEGVIDLRGQRVGVILSGGNVDPALLLGLPGQD